MKFVLIDCNNFFVACECIFKPYLKNKPVIVLSNNDGCVVSRSKEAKKLGIKMGEAYFKIEKLVKKNKVYVFSSNYKLYGDISNRLMNFLSSLGFNMEIYSIDEAFLKIDKFDNNIEEYFINIKNKILKDIGIPVSIGIAPNKVLAKIATSIAKENKLGVLDLIYDEANISKILKLYKVEELWGISKKYAYLLNKLNINTAYDLKTSDAKFIRKYLNINIERIVLELNGKVCFEINKEALKKSISCSRTFKTEFKDIKILEAYLASFTSLVAEKLRDSKCLAKSGFLYIATNRFKTPYYYNALKFNFNDYTSSTNDIYKLARDILHKIYKHNTYYKKLGVGLLGIIHQDFYQSSLFDYINKDKENNKAKLQSLIDAVNKVKPGSLYYASCANKKLWQNKAKIETDINNWNKLMLVK